MHHQHEGKRCCGFFGWLSLILVIVGGLNWGTIGVFNFNFVSAIFHTIPWLERVIYILVGLGAIGTIIACIRWCTGCKEKRCEEKCGKECRDSTHHHHDVGGPGTGGPTGGPQV